MTVHESRIAAASETYCTQTSNPAQRPDLTVIILTYNSASTIGNCLNALVRQDNKDFEVLVVDDDSTDATLAIVSSYSSQLRLSIARNGSHIIPRGRNIGIGVSRTALVAFVDSDDFPAHDWTNAILEAFRKHPNTALLSGKLVPAYRTRTGQAIALNDDAIRSLFGGGVIQFCAGNCAINRAIIEDVFFDEDFRAAEDLELASRVGRMHPWLHVSEMKVFHYSRETFIAYGRQMYRYAFSKQIFSYTSRTYRLLDFVPLGLIVCSAVVALDLQSWWFLLAIFIFSALEAIFVIFYQRCPATIAVLTLPAWLVKNVAWSCGLLHGMAHLVLRSDTRRLMRSKRLSKAVKL